MRRALNETEEEELGGRTDRKSSTVRKGNQSREWRLCDSCLSMRIASFANSTHQILCSGRETGKIEKIDDSSESRLDEVISFIILSLSSLLGS